ncbi:MULTISPECIES: hypothetical protein [Rhodomicrobium]|uniref:hypothetical protein n=1 Tax=Rhodomicrobium TaxID=1068 RepID=UPI001481E314|nr:MULTISPECIES: hypothetical protein [Rhodomicrobium]
MSASTAPLAQAASLTATPPEAAAKTYFFLTGESAYDLLPRVLIPFTKLGLVPYRVHASTEQGAGEEMSIELRFFGLTAAASETLAARCRAIIGIRTVMTVAEAG